MARLSRQRDADGDSADAGAAQPGALTGYVSPGECRADGERSGFADQTTCNPPGARPQPPPCR